MLGSISNENPERGITDEEVVESVSSLAVVAIHHSAAITASDQFRDPINYWLGVWGKMIALEAIQHQAAKQEMDPETDLHKLDWVSIRREILLRIPKKFKGIFGGNACYDWFQNRLSAYKKQFPIYKRGADVDSVIGQLIGHYSKRVAALQESGYTINDLYREHQHEQPSPGALSVKEIKLGKGSLDPSQDKDLVETRSKENENNQSISGNYSNETLDSYEQSGRSIVEIPDCLVSGIVENNAKTDSMKENQPNNEIMTTGRTDFKRSKIYSREMKKAKLLSMLWTFNSGDGLLCIMSDEVKKLGKSQGEPWPCEYTLDRIEEKILEFEITDLNVLISSIRCLVAIYLSSRNERKLTLDAARLLDNLRKFTIEFRSFENDLF